jgi:hypothetical protein
MGNSTDWFNKLHINMENLSKEIYKEISSKDADHFRFSDDKFYLKFEEPLKILDRKGLIKLQPVPKTSKSADMEKISPEYIIYMCTAKIKTKWQD